MKNLLYQSIARLAGAATLCLLATSGFAVEGESGVASSGSAQADWFSALWPLSGEYTAQATYVGDGDVQRGKRVVRDFDETDTILHFVLTPRIEAGVLRLGVEWERFSFRLPSGAAIPDTLQSVNLVLGLDTQFSDSILVRFEAQPGMYNTGFINVSDDFNMPFIVGGTYIYSPSLQLVLGVSVDIERKYPVIPAAGIRWKVTPQWVVDAVMPTPRTEFEMKRNLLLYAGATIKEANFRVDDHFGDTHGLPQLNHAVLTYSEIRTGGGFDWKISPVVTLTAEAGYQPYRDFDFYRTEVRYHQEAGAPYGMISLHGAF